MLIMWNLNLISVQTRTYLSYLFDSDSMFHVHSVLERYITFLRVLAMLSFSVIILSSAIEIDPYSQKGGDLCIQPE